MRFLYILFVLMITAACAFAQGGTFTTVNYPGADYTSIQGINNNGDLVGYFSTNGFIHGFVDVGGVFTQLDVPGTTNTTEAFAINDVGQVVGGDIQNDPFLYDIATGTFTLFKFPDPAIQVYATGINNAGVIVGKAYVYGWGVHAGFKIVNGALTLVRLPGVASTELTSINNLGQITALARDAHNNIVGSYLLNPGQKPRLVSIPSSPSAYVVGINDNGIFAGDVPFGCCFNAGFEWVPPIVVPVVKPGNEYTYSNGINNSNQVVGSYNQALSGQGYIWTPSE